MLAASCSYGWYAGSTAVSMNINQITLSAHTVPCEHRFATIRSRYPMPTLLQYCQPPNDVMAESLKRMTTTLQGRHHTRKQSGSLNELKDMVG